MEVLEIIEKILKLTKKAWIIITLVCLILLFFIWYYLPEIHYSSSGTFDVDFMLRIIFTIVDFVICIILTCAHYYFKKNRSKLPGVGFIINTSILKGKNPEKDMFLQKFKKETYKKFKIIIYDDEKNLTEEKISNMLEDYNLDIIFVIEEVAANKNGEKVYLFKIEGVMIKFYTLPVNPEKFKKEIEEDLENSMNQCIEITEKNNYDDSCKESETLSAEILYIMALISIVSKSPEKGMKLLDELSCKINNSKKKNVRYIRKKIPQRYLDGYIAMLRLRKSKEKYYNDEIFIQGTKMLIKDANEYIEKNYKSSLIKAKTYIAYKDCLLAFEGINNYDSKNLVAALECMKKISNIPENNVIKKLNLAFLYAANNDYENSYNLYNEVKQKKELKNEDWFTIENVNRFINDRLDNDPTNVGIMFCSAVLNILFKDRVLGIKELEKLSASNEKIKRIQQRIIENI